MHAVVREDAIQLRHLAPVRVGSHILAVFEREPGVNKQDLVVALAKRLSTTKAHAAEVLDHIFDGIE